MKRRRQSLRKDSGQTMVEYVLIMFVVVTALVFILGKLKQSQFFYKKVTEPLIQHITYNYKYGDPTSQGWDENTPKRHIQISKPGDGNTFRLFQPRKQ